MPAPLAGVRLLKVFREKAGQVIPAVAPELANGLAGGLAERLNGRLCRDTLAGSLTLRTTAEGETLSSQWQPPEGDDSVRRDGDPFALRRCLPLQEPLPLAAGAVAIVVILESPHRDEYSPRQDFGLPAMGKSGRSLRDGLAAILRGASQRLPLDTPCPLVILNAVQYQCSLGLGQNELTAKRRRLLTDRMLEAMWQRSCVVRDFRERLGEAVDSLGGRDRVVVVNCCPQVIRHQVEEAITERLERGSDVRTTHPAHWNISYW